MIWKSKCILMTNGLNLGEAQRAEQHAGPHLLACTELVSHMIGPLRAD